MTPSNDPKGPPLCLCLHLKKEHGEDGKCTANNCTCVQFVEMTAEALNHRKHLLEKQEKIFSVRNFFKEWGELAGQYSLMGSRVNFHYCKMHAERYDDPDAPPEEGEYHEWQSRADL